MGMTDKIRAYVAANRTNVIIYGVAILITLALSIALIVWASFGGNLDDLLYVDATVRLSENARREYLVNESISPDMYSLELEDGRVIEGKDCKTEADLTSAGVKNIAVSWQDGQTVYEGSFNVTVFAVRHISIEQYPTDYWIDMQGNPVLGSPVVVPEAPEEGEEGEESEENAASAADGGLVVWAELSGEPTEFSTPEEHPDWTTTIVLTPELYNLTGVKTQEGYAFEVSCGNVKSAFAFVNIGVNKQLLRLQSLDTMISFENTSGSSEKLTLYVSQSERNFEDGANESTMAQGTYVYTAANGGVTTFQFTFYLEGLSSHFISAEKNNWQIIDGVNDAAWGGDMQVTVSASQKVFRGKRADWHLAILDNRA